YLEFAIGFDRQLNLVAVLQVELLHERGGKPDREAVSPFGDLHGRTSVYPSAPAHASAFSSTGANRAPAPRITAETTNDTSVSPKANRRLERSETAPMICGE